MLERIRDEVSSAQSMQEARAKKQTSKPKPQQFLRISEENSMTFSGKGPITFGD